MQAPRNWRNNVERYRPTVNVDNNGNASVMNRPQSLAQKVTPESNDEEREEIRVTAA
ncbi:MAG: hypothetical protein AAF846_05055 [Chloroflexota bacterium]